MTSGGADYLEAMAFAMLEYVHTRAVQCTVDIAVGGRTWSRRYGTASNKLAIPDNSMTAAPVQCLVYQYFP
jgi:hypothetical protein